MPKFRTAPITLEVNGSPFNAWASVSVVEEVDRPGLEFTLQMNPAGQPVAIRTGASCLLKFNGQILANGQVRRRRNKGDKDNGQKLTLTGRDRIGKLAKHHSTRKQQWTKVRLDRIATDLLAEVGLRPVFTSAFSYVFPQYDLQQGDNLLDTLTRALQFEGQTMRWNPVTERVEFRAVGDIDSPHQAPFPAPGVESSEVVEDDTERYQFYTVLADAPAVQYGEAADAIQEPVTVEDKGITDGSTLVTVASNPANGEGTLKLAQYQRAIHLGRARRYSQTYNNWAQALRFKIGENVYVKDTHRGIKQFLLVASRELAFDQKDGQRAVVTFVPKEAYAARADSPFSKAKGVVTQWGED